MKEEKNDKTLEMKFGIYEGIAATIVSSITSSFLSVYIIYLGGTNTDVGLVAAFPALAALLSYIPGAYLAEAGYSRRKIASAFAIISRSLWIPVAILPIFIFDDILTVMILVTISSMAGAFVSPSWSSLMGDIVPAGERGRYFGSRNRLCVLFSMIAVLSTGLIINFFGSGIGFVVSFTIAGLAGVISGLFFLKFPDKKIPIIEKINVRRDIRNILSDKRFRNFTITFAVFQLGVSMALPFFNVYLIKNLSAPYIWISVILIVNGIFQIIFQKGWGSVSDKFGHMHILIITVMGATLIPLLWLFAPNFEFTAVIEIISGIAWSGFNLASFNYLLEISRGKKRTIATSLFWTFTGISIFIGPIVGGYIADYVNIGSYLMLVNIQFVFFLAFLFRAAGAIMMIKTLKEVRTEFEFSTRYVTSEIIDMGFARIEQPFTMIKITSASATKRSVKFLMRHVTRATMELRRRKVTIPARVKKEIAEIRGDVRKLSFVRQEKLKKLQVKEARILIKLYEIRKKNIDRVSRG